MLIEDTLESEAVCLLERFNVVYPNTKRETKEQLTLSMFNPLPANYPIDDQNLHQHKVYQGHTRYTHLYTVEYKYLAFAYSHIFSD